MPIKTRRNFLQSLGLGTLALSLSPIPRCTFQARKRPNILFIMSDDHAAPAIRAYGSKINNTPNIDRIAEAGMRFTHCFCTNSLCAPSRATILTGKYSHLNGVLDNATRFDANQQTLPGLLQQAGYQTAIVGKWHLRSEPTGFDYSHILIGQGTYYDPIMLENGIQRQHEGYVTDLITDLALQWLKHRKSSQPFFLMLNHKAPHANWVPSKQHNHLYSDRDVPLPPTFYDDYKTRRGQIANHRLLVGPKQWDLHFKERLGNLPAAMTEPETREWVYQKYIKNYLRCVASIDDNVGRVLDFLDHSGLSENTLVVYTSDQGFFLGEHGLYDKRFMYEPSIRMPLLLKFPKIIEPGTTSDLMVLNLDFAPTFLEFAGVPVPADIQGRSFYSITRGNPPGDWRKAMYYRFYETAFGIGPHEGIRTQRYKLIHFLYGDKGWELFDLNEDPNELNNLYDNPEYKDLIARLINDLNTLKKQYKVSD